MYYQSNRDSAIFQEIESLIIKTSGVAYVLKQCLQPLQERIETAFIYGSFAKGTETARSDVDVLIIGTVSFSEISDLLDAAQHSLGREVNPSVYPVDEFVAKIVEGHDFVTSLIEEPKIFLIGDEDDFGRLVEKRMVG